jgi:hypothetical protein
MLVLSHFIFNSAFNWHNEIMTHRSHHSRKHSEHHSALKALPHVGSESVLLDTRTARAVMAYLRRIGSAIPDAVDAQLDALVEETLPHLEQVPGREDAYALTVTELRGLLANAAIRGTTQAAFSIGSSLHEAEELRRQLAPLFEPHIPTGENGVGEDQQPAA